MRSNKRHDCHLDAAPPAVPRQFGLLLLLLAGGGFLLADANRPGGSPGSAAIAQEPGAAEPDASPAGEPAAEAPASGELPAAYRFEVTLPLRASTEALLKQRVEQALRSLPEGGQRPVFIFEFRPQPNSAGEGTEFGHAINLARYISGDRLANVKTVAWLPATVKGHAVLLALACEQIVMSQDAQIGAAGQNETTIDRTLRTSYNEIAERRRTVPPAVAQGLLDRNLAVYKVTTLEGVRYETAETLAALRSEGKVSQEETIFQPGEEHLLSGREMRFAHGFASHLAGDRRELASALQLPVKALDQKLTPEEGWRPIRVDLHGPIHSKGVNTLLRTIEDHESRLDFNLLVLSIRSGGGDLDESRRLAEYLAAVSERIHTVAYVDKMALGDAALVALACDELVMHPSAMLGGPGETVIPAGELDAARDVLPGVFRPTGRDWSLTLAMIDPRVQVYRFTHSLGNDVRYLSEDEAQSLPDADRWQRDERPIATERGLEGLSLEEMGLARTVQNFAELKALYHIEGELAPVRANWALAMIEWLADPRIAWILLFIAWFALMFEMSTPGIGLPGFISVLCFLFFFWSHFLHGTAGWLEILLFVGGITCLAIEIFALPGFGVFGFGGALMVVVSIILASQTFVVPGNAYQMRQFPISLLMVAAGMAGGVVSVFVIRKFLPDTPYFNRMLLQPPRAAEREELSRREALVAWEHLKGKRGVTTTPLVPAGKAQFGDELVDVISNGELIAKGTPVIVEEVAGNRVVVRKAYL